MVIPCTKERAQNQRVVEDRAAEVYIHAMGASCCHDCHEDDPQRGNAAYRRILWVVLAINAVMFAVEIGAGLAVGSASLQADALDFLGDAGNYAISLFVVGMALRYRAMAARRRGAPWPSLDCGF
jgi:cation efflux family protein